ncbi:MAG: aspartyl protease family protein [Pyrinomonadaceae bacterium]
MGEVRVKIKLVNAGDEAMFRRGRISKEEIRTYETSALVDTGAIPSVLPIEIVQKLGLDLIRKERATYANNSSENVDVTEPVSFEILGRRVTEEALVLGDEVIIGQIALERTDLLVDCVNQKVIPNPAHPDQAVIKVK